MKASRLEALGTSLESTLKKKKKRENKSTTKSKSQKFSLTFFQRAETSAVAMCVCGLVVQLGLNFMR
jgi:hypothetical protein